MKIVYNDRFGGFGLSNEAMELYLTKKGFTPFYKQMYCSCMLYSSEPFVKDGSSYKTDGKYYHYSEIERDDPILIEVIEQLGEKANGDYAELKIVEIPDDVKWEISEYDGNETVREQSRSWG